MGQTTLVEMQIQHAERLIERLVEKGIGVTVACWAKDSEGGDWNLYVATPLISKEGSKSAARHRVYDVVREMQNEGYWIENDQLKLVSSRDPMVADLLAHREHRSPKTPSWYRDYKLGNLAIEEAYVYPLPGTGDKEKTNEQSIGNKEALQP